MTSPAITQPIFYIKRNDDKPDLVATLADANGVAVDLTGATVKFFMTSGRTLLVNSTASPATDQVNNKGQVTYHWAKTDTALAGTFNGEFEVIFSDGHIESFPTNTYIKIIIKPDLG